MAADGLAYRLERRRRRSLCLQVQEDLGLRVLAPLRARQADIDAFVLAQRDWIERKRAELGARGPGVSRLPPEGSRLPVLDAHVELRRVADGRGVREEKGCLWVAGDDARALRLLKGWYRERARLEAQRLIAQWSPIVGRSPAGLVIREQRTRWGSCSASGVIALNWRLALGPRALLEYVVVHELCHLIHRHHRPSFWVEVRRVLPDYAARRVALRSLAATWSAGAGPQSSTTDESAAG